MSLKSSFGAFLALVVCSIFLIGTGVHAEESAAFDSAVQADIDSIKKADAEVPAIGSIKPTGIKFDFGFGRGNRRDRYNDGRRGRDRGRWNPPGRSRPGRGYGRTAYSCSATDKGWEEHWGGHHGRGYDLRNSRSEACRSCKKPNGPHGSCNVTCGVPEFRCRAEFVPRSSEGRSGTVRGYLEETQYRAEESALDNCRRDFWREEGRCRIRSCDQESRTVLRERC